MILLDSIQFIDLKEQFAQIKNIRYTQINYHFISKKHKKKLTFNYLLLFKNFID